MKKNLAPLLAGLILMPAAGNLLAEQPAAQNPSVQQAVTPSYLGVAIGPVPREVQAQLPEDITHNQGLLIMRVMPGSPAEQAGLRQHDVLLSVNGQTLITPEDLIRVVNKTTPGNAISLELLRHGRVQKKDVTLEAKQVRQPGIPSPYPRMNAPQPMMPALPTPPVPEGNSGTRTWQSFQAISISKQPDGSYQASVEFLDDKGGKQQFEFKGSKNEVIEQVKKESNLPEDQKQQLLNALQGNNSPGFPGQVFPAFPDFEQMESEFFQPPPWARSSGRGFWD
jgi:membrane-associated protease RseP (regulator of RpoE activity)